MKVWIVIVKELEVVGPMLIPCSSRQKAIDIALSTLPDFGLSLDNEDGHCAWSDDQTQIWIEEHEVRS